MCIRDRRRNEDIRQELKTKSLHKKIKDSKRRRWAACQINRLLVADLKYEPNGKRDVGRPRRRRVLEHVNQGLIRRVEKKTFGWLKFLLPCSLRKWKYGDGKKNRVRDCCRFWLYYTQNMKKSRFSKSVCVCVCLCVCVSVCVSLVFFYGKR